MSYLSSIKDVLTTFATDSNDRAIIFKGPWGTGKTHLWKQVTLQKREAFAKRSYSYVSLFGINNLKDLKQALFENKVTRENAHINPSEATLSENLKDVGNRSAGFFRKSSSLLKDLSAFGVKGFGPAIEALQFLRVTDTLIVLDDFERKGSGLQDREILGLISLLVETRNCRVIMLLHENNLSKEYFSYHEKVFDYEIQFTPSSEDAAEIVFGDQTGITEKLKENCIRLKITNIRLLKKINYYAKLIENPLLNADRAVAEQAYLILPLAILSLYGGDDSKVDIDFILHGAQPEHMPGTKPTADNAEGIRTAQEKLDYLGDYGFDKADEFDAAIISFIETGYVEKHKLDAMITAVEKKNDHARQVSKLKDAWELYHSSFGNNEKIIIAGFQAAISAALESFSISELDAVANTLYLLDEETYVNSTIDEYVKKYVRHQGLTEKDQVFDWPSHPYLSAKLDDFFASLDTHTSLKELVLDIYESDNGIQRRNALEQLASEPKEAYYSLLSTLDDLRLNGIVRMLLKCGQVTTSEPARQGLYNEVFIKTYEALTELSTQSKLNKARVAKFKGYSKLYKEISEEMKTPRNIVP